MQVVTMISRILALPLVILVWVYQQTFSPDHGFLKTWYPNGYCKFYPTCSSFTLVVLKQEGIIGFPKIISRLLRCNPLSLGGIDHPYKHGTHI